MKKLFLLLALSSCATAQVREERRHRKLACIHQCEAQASHSERYSWGRRRSCYRMCNIEQNMSAQERARDMNPDDE